MYPTARLFLSLLVCAASTLHVGPANAQGATPSSELKKLAPFVGDWTAEGYDLVTPLGPAGKTTSRASIRWILSGTALEWQYSLTTAAGQTFEGRELDAYDPLTKTFPVRWIESDGSYTSGVYSPSGNVITFSGTVTTAARKFDLRQTYTFSADGRSYTYKAEISLDGGKNWQVMNNSKGTKTK